jgi:1-deoxyxylulose-5-phosphate synthase
MSLSNRREFLQTSMAAAAAVALPSVSTAFAADSKPDRTVWKEGDRHATDVIELGPAKLKVSRMAVGTGTLGAGYSSNQLRALGLEGVADMWKYAYDNGVFFWDTSDGYGTHGAIKIALKKIARENIAILTKTDAETAADLKADLVRFRQEMGVDSIDIILLHSRFTGEWETRDKALMDVLSEAKQQGKVGQVGVSCHSLAAIETAAKSKWLDICLCRINPAGERMDASPEEVMAVMKKLRDAGKGVIGMKVYGEGTLIDRMDECIKFALDKSPANCFTIGCESKNEVKDNIDRIARLGKKA